MLEDTDSLDGAHLIRVEVYPLQRHYDALLLVFSALYEPCQANLCLRAFRHDKFQLRMSSHSEGPGIWLSV